MKLSIIVPVYNSEKTIKRCLDSIARQSFSDYELIIINDGSNDNSLNIINEFIENNKHLDIKLINQDNIGLTKSRQKGINKASGKYIGFVDSDDYIDKDYYQSFFDYLNNNDTNLVCNGYQLNGKQYINKTNSSIDNKQAKKLLLNHQGVYQYAWNKIYQKDLLKDIKFEDVNYIGEDFILVMQVLDKTKQVGVVNNTGYHYCLTNDSMSQKVFNDDYVEMYNIFSKYYDDFSKDKDLVIDLDNYYILHYMYILVNMFKANEHNPELEKGIMNFVKKRYQTYLKTSNDSFIAKTACLIACKNYSLFKLISRYI